MRKLPTVSEMPRAVACAASVVKPRRPDDGEQSAAALRGSRIHAYIAARLRKWPMPDLGKTKVKHIQLGKLRRYLGHGLLFCEEAYCYHGEGSIGVEVLGENINRAYDRPGTLCGSADIIVERPHAMVVDVKTGSLPVPHPRENWQLATLAVLYWLTHPGHCLSVTGVIATLARDGSWSFEAHTWSLDDLAAIRRRIDAARATWAEAHELEVSGWGAPTTPGAHCRWCPARCEHSWRREGESENGQAA